MSSQKQIQANQQNAQNSTGPRTVAGKNKSSMNAIKHGLFAKNAVLEYEDKSEFETMVRRLKEDWEPEGEMEHILIERIATLLWRLNRIVGIETSLVDHRCNKYKNRYYVNESSDTVLALVYCGDKEELSKISGYEKSLSKLLSNLLKELSGLQKARKLQSKNTP